MFTESKAVAGIYRRFMSVQKILGTDFSLYLCHAWLTWACTELYRCLHLSIKCVSHSVTKRSRGVQSTVEPTKLSTCAGSRAWSALCTCLSCQIAHSFHQELRLFRSFRWFMLVSKVPVTDLSFCSCQTWLIPDFARFHMDTCIHQTSVWALYYVSVYVYNNTSTSSKDW